MNENRNFFKSGLCIVLHGRDLDVAENENCLPFLIYEDSKKIFLALIIFIFLFFQVRFMTSVISVV